MHMKLVNTVTPKPAVLETDLEFAVIGDWNPGALAPFFQKLHTFGYTTMSQPIRKDGVFVGYRCKLHTRKVLTPERIKELYDTFPA